MRQLQLCVIHHSCTAPFSLLLGLPTIVLATQKQQQLHPTGKPVSFFQPQLQVLASHQIHIRVSHHPKSVFHFCWGQEPCWQERLFPWVPPDTVRFEINGGETKRSPSWKSRVGLVAFFWYETPLQPASFFSPPYRYFILLRQTARAQAGNCFPRRFQRKQRKQINISAPFPDSLVWKNRCGQPLADERTPAAKDLGGYKNPCSLCLYVTASPVASSTFFLLPVLSWNSSPCW